MLNTKALAASASAPKTYVEDVFSTWLYTGDGIAQGITNGIDLSGKGGLVWIKGRSGATGHRFTDTARGVTKSLDSSSVAAQITEGTGLVTFRDDGFALQFDSDYNANGATYASWTFRKQAKFFDVVVYSGNGSVSQTISHNLGSTPGCIIVKRINAVDNWTVYHTSLGATKYLELNQTGAAGTDINRWNNTAPTSTTFTVGVDSSVNDGSSTYVAYLFAHDAGGFGDSGNDSVVKCGTFTCDGSGNVGTVSLGWEPQWILAKRTDTTQNWYIWDTMRGWDLTNQPWLAPNLSNAEGNPAASYFAPTATGFSGTGNWFGTNAQVVYIAIRRGPMKTPTDATKVFSAGTSSSSPATYTTNFPVDLFWNPKRSGSTDNFATFDRLRGSTASSSKYLVTSSTAAEATGTGFGAVFDSNTTVQSSGLWGTNAQLGLCFRRAPGYFDAVCYTGTGSARTVSHNLGVAPEMMIIKVRNTGSNWSVYSSSLGNTKYIELNSTSASGTSTFYWDSTSPTSSVFTLGLSGNVNGSGNTHIAYLFATCPGVSKCFNFTGTGTTLQIDCGFTNGARFVMIKRTDSTGDWYVWDSARGIISGNDPYLLLNSTAAEVTNTDYIDPYSAGFEISSTAPAAINANGGSYIGLAIA
jgi:hypothetical protein